MEYKILVAEDDMDISNLICLYLSKEGYDVITAFDGKEAVETALLTRPHLILMDIMMPQMNGINAARELRKSLSAPIIFLSAKGKEEDKIKGLNAGGDDYITKPFSPAELIARINSNLRRCYDMNQEAHILKVQDLTLDKDKMIVTVGDREEPLTLTEFKIIQCLMKNAGTVLTKKEICSYVYGEDFLDSDVTSIPVHISKIRNKIEDDTSDPKYIVNVRGLGYKFEK